MIYQGSIYLSAKACQWRCDSKTEEHLVFS